MALPKQVQDQLKELEKIEQQLAQNKVTPPADPAENKDPEPAPAEPPKDPEPAPTDPAPVEKTPEAPAEPPVAEETWQQKYRTLKGMYDAEVPRLHAQVKELNARMEQLQRDLQAPKTETKPQTSEKLVTDADVEAFGSDLIEVQRKVAREVAQEFRAELEALKAENTDLRKQIGETGTKVVEASFEQRLHRMVPDFEAINADVRWIDWLNEMDPMLRAPRKVVAQEAFNRGDAEAVAYYIGMFKQSIAAPVSEPTPTKNKELERQVQPSRSSTASATVPQKGKTYSSSQIQAMFQKAALLGGQGKHDEARQLEAEIDAAYMEGRVTA